MGNERIRWIVHRMVRFMRIAGGRPVYLGELAIETGLSLARTESLVEQLINMGVMRMMTDGEKAAVNIDRQGILVILLDHTLIPEVER